MFVMGEDIGKIKSVIHIVLLQVFFYGYITGISEAVTCRSLESYCVKRAPMMMQQLTWLLVSCTCLLAVTGKQS